MDIQTSGGPATVDERLAVDLVLGEPSSIWEGGERGPADDHVAIGGRAARSRRHLLLPVLHSIQDRIGWVSRGALEYACRRLSVPPAEAYGVVSFYDRFELHDPGGSTALHICDDVACLAAGAEQVCAAADRESAGNAMRWHRSPCLGLCDRAPAALVERSGAAFLQEQVAPVTAEEAARIMKQAHSERAPAPSGVRLGGRLLRRIGVVDPDSIDSYRKQGGFAALRQAMDMGPEAVIREVTEARLLGRGGAAFPTGRKWDSVAKAGVRPHYLVCNADESEPGTFKDRVVMEEDPYSVVEAMTVAAFAAGCEQGYIYIRAEYPLARRRIEHAVEESRRHGFLGPDVEARGFAFDIEVRRGAGAYICGEETALFNSMEGKRGEPRNKPPFPVQAGLFGKPTLINNVETLVNVLDILTDGAAAFAATGTAESTGTRLFCLSGMVERPGLYEVPMGTTLRALLDQAGAPRAGRSLQAVLLGGAAGSFVTAKDLDVPLSFEGTRAIGATLGSGPVIVLDETADLRAILRRIARFFRDESCGQCVPCRVGTKRQEEILDRLFRRSGADAAADIALLSDVAQAMRDASICGLGQTAANAIASGLKQLPVLNG